MLNSRSEISGSPNPREDDYLIMTKTPSPNTQSNVNHSFRCGINVSINSWYYLYFMFRKTIL